MAVNHKSTNIKSIIVNLLFNSMDAKLVFKIDYMKNFCLSVLTFLIVFGNNTVFGQNEDQNIETQNNTGFYIGTEASTNGLGINARYILGKRITVKAGFESLNFAKTLTFNENNISYDATIDYKTGGFYACVDYNFTNSLYVSGGAVASSFNPVLQGAATSDMQYGDITIPASKIGEFTFSFAPTLKLSPYGGLGYRKFFGPKNRVALNFETGIYYFGPPQIDIKATGLLAPTADPAHGQKSSLEKQFESYKVYPVVKLNLAVKLF